MGMSRIAFTIEKVVLRGFELVDRTALEEGLQEELRRMLSDRAVCSTWTSSRRTPVLKLGSIPFSPGPAGAKNFGGRLAKAIGKGLNP
jgi:hypothetical protein